MTDFELVFTSKVYELPESTFQQLRSLNLGDEGCMQDYLDDLREGYDGVRAQICYLHCEGFVVSWCMAVQRYHSRSYGKITEWYLPNVEVFTHPAFRSRGYGSIVFQEMKKVLRADYSVAPWDEAGCAFFTKNGEDVSYIE